MINNRPFKITLNINGEVKNIISMYYRHIGNIPIFSCNDMGSYRLLEVGNNEKVIIIGSDLLSKLNDIDIEILAWILILRYDTGLNRSDYKLEDAMYIDSIISNIYGISALTDTLRHILELIKLDKKQTKLIKYRINYLENEFLNNFSYKNIDVNNILKRVNLAQVLEVE